MRIFLVGYMAVGKTTVGKKLAKALALNFVDLDQLIEKQERRTISEIFEKEGESSFRGVERNALVVASELENVVISTGGGAPCFYDNMSVMNEKGITIYLEMDVMSIAYRLQHSNDPRPLVLGKSSEELESFVRFHLEERKEFYEEAQIKFNALGFNPKKLEQLIDIIIEKANYSK
ncbi:MAG: shikimate kinase [Flavobacteriales bacterium]